MLRHHNPLIDFFLKKVTYFWLHFLFFVSTTLIASGFIALFDRELSYINSLFIAVSAMTCTGLEPVDFSTTKTATQIIVYFLIICGNTVLMSLPALVFSRLRNGSGERDVSRELLRRRAMTRMIAIVFCYYFGILLSFTIMNLVYFGAWEAKREILEQNNANFVWYSFFQSASAFGNAGFTLLSLNLVPFNSSSFVLQTTASQILLGNTLFPVAIYCIVSIIRWTSILLRFNSHEVYDYLLSHPRSCFTHIYSFHRTIWLICIIIFINATQVILTLIIDWNGASLTIFDPVFKIQNAIFQSISTRTAGFNSLVLTNESPSILFLYVMFMYISSYPLVISIQKTAEVVRKVDMREYDSNGKEAKTRKEYLQDGLFRAVYTDLAIVSIGILLVCIMEDHRLQNDPNFSIFAVIFEVVSAYGTVGLSLGYGSYVYSFSGVWHWYSKVVLIIVMLFGRHRGLPASHDLMFGGRIHQNTIDLMEDAAASDMSDSQDTIRV